MSALDLTEFRGQWVAVRRGRLIGHAPTAAGIIDGLTRLGWYGRGTTIWFEARPEDVRRWAVMYPSRPGHVGPNCLFDTREAAQRWIDSWRHASVETGYVVTRAGQHEEWSREV